MNEFDLINHYFNNQGIKRQDVIQGIGDDGAILQFPSDQHLIVTTDTLVAGNHFLETAPAAAIAHKALASNLSDLAAMGAMPLWCSLALTLPRVDTAWIASFCEGFYKLANKHQVQLIGGDTTKGPLSLTLTLHGAVPKGKALCRKGAKAGDLIYVTGYLGESAAGLDCLLNDKVLVSNTDKKALIDAHYYAIPRLEAGQAVRTLASSGLDISDGLVSDLKHILTQSQVGGQINADCLPLSPLFKRYCKDPETAAKIALTSGEEYELCLTLPPCHKKAFEQALIKTNTPFTVIGQITDQKGLSLYWQGKPCDWILSGWDHFA